MNTLKSLKRNCLSVMPNCVSPSVARPAQQLREVVELLELGGLLFGQVGVELVAAELGAHAERMRRRRPAQACRRWSMCAAARRLKLSFGPPNENRSIVPPGRPM